MLTPTTRTFTAYGIEVRECVHECTDTMHAPSTSVGKLVWEVVGSSRELLPVVHCDFNLADADGEAKARAAVSAKFAIAIVPQITGKVAERIAHNKEWPDMRPESRTKYRLSRLQSDPLKVAVYASGVAGSGILGFMIHACYGLEEVEHIQRLVDLANKAMEAEAGAQPAPKTWRDRPALL